MNHSIGEVATATGIAISTLRYYDREGLFMGMARSNGGIRVFTDAEIGTLRIIECLKTAGLSIKEIKQFLDWCQQGDATIGQRRDMFHQRREVLHQQMTALEKTLNVIEYKCWYYDTAMAAGTEQALVNMPADQIPEDIQRYKRDLEP